VIRSLQNRLFPPANPLAKAVLSLTGKRPKNLSLYELAFTHSSVRKEGETGFRKNNERLEFLGDAVLDLAIAEILFKKYPYKDEGFLTEMRSRVVNANSLDAMARKLGLNKLLVTFSGNTRGQSPSKNMNADALEALIGAFYLDHGYPATLRFINQRIVKAMVDFEEVMQSDNNHKSRLVEWSHRNGKSIRFDVAETIQQGRHRIFIVQLLVDEQVVATGKDINKKQAEQMAAGQFLAAVEK
jgi:ribonuclease-3